MRKMLALSLAAIIMAGCGSKKEKDSYVISGDIQGIPDSTMVELYPMSHSKSDPIAEAMVIGGKFEFSGKAEEPILVMLTVKDNYGSTRFMLENADIQIKGNASAEDVADGKKDYDFKDITVEGSPLTDKYNELMSGRNELDRQFLAMRENYSDIMEITTGSDKGKSDSVRATDRFKAMLAEESRLFAGFDSVFNAVVRENKDSFWGPLMMIAQVTYLSPANRELYEVLSDSAKNSHYGKMVYKELYPLGRPGDKVPDFTATDIKGGKISLSEIAKANKYVLVDFWASWCRPCRAEIPNVKAIYDKHHADGFEIVSVSIDEEENPWIKAVEKEGLVWPNARDTDKSIAGKYNVTAVPTMVVIDSEGKLVAENLRGEELAAKIDELMSK